MVSAAGIMLRCSKCRATFRVVRKIIPAADIAPPPRPTAVSGKLKVIVANESPAFCAAVKKVLATEPFDLYLFNDGREAFEGIELLRPDVVLLDVALPSMYGFEICERIRKNPLLAESKIILIASIYDKTRYKRSPNSLYGADDYIEKHHIPDSLVAMIYRLVGNQKPLSSTSDDSFPPEEEVQTTSQQLSPTEMIAQEDTRVEIKQDEERETGLLNLPQAIQQPSEAHVKARRLARIIVSDIFLYNQAKVEEGIRNGGLYQLLEDDIREGRLLYERRVPEEIRDTTAYLDEAFEELIAKKRDGLNL
jgi:DNA-binding response OmpR family regulator